MEWDILKILKELRRHPLRYKVINEDVEEGVFDRNNLGECLGNIFLSNSQESQYLIFIDYQPFIGDFWLPFSESNIDSCFSSDTDTITIRIHNRDNMIECCSLLKSKMI